MRGSNLGAWFRRGLTSGRICQMTRLSPSIRIMSLKKHCRQYPGRLHVATEILRDEEVTGTASKIEDSFAEVRDQAKGRALDAGSPPSISED